MANPPLSPEEIEKRILENKRQWDAADAKLRAKITFDWRVLPRTQLTPESDHPKNSPHPKLQLADGRMISLVSMNQSFIYAGDLLGAITHPESRVLDTLRRAQRLHPNVSEAFVVLPPTLLTYSHPSAPMLAPPERNLGPVTLPRIAVIAMFDSGPLAKVDSECSSSLVVIWFQDKFGDPAQEIIEQIAQLDWNELAWDWAA